MGMGARFVSYKNILESQSFKFNFTIQKQLQGEKLQGEKHSAYKIFPKIGNKYKL